MLICGFAVPAPVKRKGFFSFHFDDLLRVNNVRNAWKISHPDRPFMRNFYDRSMWETKKRESDDALKSLIRAGMEHSSAVCVLVGTATWSRQWVKYEIARSVVTGEGCWPSTSTVSTIIIVASLIPLASIRCT